MSGLSSLSCRAYFTAPWQQMRLQLGFSSFREPTHCTMTTRSHLAASSFGLMEKIAQLQLGHHPLVFPVEKFLGVILVGAGGHHGDPVVDFPLVHAGPHQHFRGEVAFVAAESPPPGPR